MTNCTAEPVVFPSCKRRLVEASFSGGAITSDGDAVLLRQADRMLGLTDRAAQALTDTRRNAPHGTPTLPSASFGSNTNWMIYTHARMKGSESAFSAGTGSAARSGIKSGTSWTSDSCSYFIP